MDIWGENIHLQNLIQVNHINIAFCNPYSVSKIVYYCLIKAAFLLVVINYVSKWNKYISNKYI